MALKATGTLSAYQPVAKASGRSIAVVGAVPSSFSSRVFSPSVLPATSVLQ